MPDDTTSTKSAGGEMTLGVRPEDILITTAVSDTAIEGIVTNVAFWGRQKIVNVIVEETRATDARSDTEPTQLKLAATVNADVAINKEDHVGVSLDASKLHFFDLKTGQAI